MYGSLGKPMEGYNQWYVKIMISQPDSYIPNFYTATYCTSAYQDFIVAHHLPSKGLFPYH